jgi:predicted PurR-regulated permease PerM
MWAHRRDVAWAILGWGTLVAAALWLAGHVLHTLVILTIAALLAYALAPLVGVLRRVMPRWAAVTLVYVALIALMVTVSSVVVSSLIVQITGLANQVSIALSPTHPGGNAPLYDTLLKLGLSPDQINTARDYATTQIAAAAGGIAPFLAGALSVALDILVVVVLSVYLMADGARITAWLRTGLPVSQRARGALIADTVERVAGGYIRGEMLMCFSIGTLVGLGMWALGIPFAALLGIAAFFLEFIPFFGPGLSAVFALLIAWPQGGVKIALVIGWFIVIHIIEGYILQPRLVGGSVGVNPTILLIAAFAAGEVFGLWGALFAAPVAGVAQSFLRAIWQSWRVHNPEQFPSEARVTPEELAPPAESTAP